MKAETPPTLKRKGKGMKIQTTFPHFIRLMGVIHGEFWVNANLIEQVTPAQKDYLTPTYKNTKSVIWMSGTPDDSEGIHVCETPEEIFERIYDNPDFTNPEPK